MMFSIQWCLGALLFLLLSLTATSMTPTPTPQKSSLRVNFGDPSGFESFDGDDGRYLVDKETSTYSGSGAGIYKSHRSDYDFGLKFQDLVPGTYQVIFHFNENFERNCVEGGRVFTISIGGEVKIENFDVFKKAGCKVPTTEIVKDVEVSEALEVLFSASVQQSFVSGIEIFTAEAEASSPTPTPEPETTASASGEVSKLQINIGGPREGDFQEDDGSYLTGSATAYTIGELAGVYKSHVAGNEFEYSIPVSPGTYDLVLHFAETFKRNCATGKRVFAVSAGGKSLEDVDIFERAGCETPHTESLVGIEADDTVQIKFTAVTQNAFVSAIEIAETGSVVQTPSSTPSPDTENSSSPDVPAPQDEADTGAHARVFVYEPFVDADGDLKHTVTLKDAGSHSHHEVRPGIQADIKLYQWKYLLTGELICPESAGKTCIADFPIGSTEFELCVTDDIDDTHCATGMVSVVGALSEGTYCYYYDLEAFTEFTDDGVALGKGLEKEESAGPKPVFGAVSKDLIFPNIEDFPDFSFKDSTWAQRCVFFFTAEEAANYTFSVKHTGGVALYAGESQVLYKESTTTGETTEGAIEVVEGIQEFELIYYKKESDAQVELSYDAPKVKFMYDILRVLPLIASMTPRSNQGDSAVVISGSSITEDIEVFFGENKVENPKIDQSGFRAEVNAPKTSEAGDVNVYLSNKAGTSNSFKFTYVERGDGPDDPVKFEETLLKKDSNADYKETVGFTGISVGPDLKYYMTTRDARVVVIDVDHEGGYIVRDSCVSSQFLDPQWIDHKTGEPAGRVAIGIAFNPKDTDGRFYISTSVVEWVKYDILNVDDAWTNGNVEILQPGGDCVERTGFLIKGLPVSAKDHAVNQMVFNNDGDLLIQIGGFTNQGVPDEAFGNLDEAPLSGASVLAKTSKGSDFDGVITYDNTDPGLARQTGGDVTVFATGLRNSFGVMLHSNGWAYATDNGPNNGFGDRSVTCSTGTRNSREEDKIVRLVEGRFFGHPNRNVERKECSFIGKSMMNPVGEDPPANYEPFLTMIESSIDGLIEYTGNTFQGKLRGDILTSRHKSNGMYRIGLNGEGTEIASGPTRVEEFNSGLSIVQGLRGEVFMPRLESRDVVVLQPVYDEPEDLRILAVTPFRGAKGGGNVVMITGHNFVDPQATFGSTPCTDIADVTKTSFKCTTPPGSGLVDVIVTNAGGEVKTAEKGFWYMNV